MNREIGDALKARLASLTFSPAIPIAWPGRDFTPDGSRYIVADVVKSPNDRLTLGAGNRWSGSFIVTPCALAGRGSGEGESLADAIAAHFPVDLALALAGGGSLFISAVPSVRSGFQDAGYWRTPVVIPFRAMTA